MMDADHVLVEKLKARDEAAFVQLIERYHGYLLPGVTYLAHVDEQREKKLEIGRVRFSKSLSAVQSQVCPCPELEMGGQPPPRRGTRIP
jgi:hypothetical protein